MNASAMETTTTVQRPAVEADGDFLRGLYTTTRLDEVAAWGWDAEQQESFLEMQFRAQRRAYQAQYGDADHQIILLGDRPIGRTVVARTGDEIRLVDIALLPEHRNRGIGTSLVTAVLDEASETGRPVRLHVLELNPGARLYERLGFRVVGKDGPYTSMEWTD